MGSPALSPFGAAALDYASAGWPVFPCATDGKEPLTAHGFKDATTDAQQIREWWMRSRTANVAVATGAPGPDVLDVDVKDGRDGMELFTRALRSGLLRGAAATIRTPSGGLHVWYEGTSQRGGAVGPHKALELKARGGYVLLPPSFVRDGRYDYAGRYEVLERRDTAGTIDFVAVRQLLEPPREVQAGSPRLNSSDTGALIRFVENLREGNRNRGLHWAACRAFEGGGDGFDLLDAALSIGLTEHEAERTIASAKNNALGVSV